MANDLPRRMTFAAIAAKAVKMTPFGRLDPEGRKGLMRRGASMGLTARQAGAEIDNAFGARGKKGGRNG